jgi:hypothetical protein
MVAVAVNGGGGAINKYIIYGTYGGVFCLRTSIRTVGL